MKHAVRPTPPLGKKRRFVFNLKGGNDNKSECLEYLVLIGRSKRYEQNFNPRGGRGGQGGGGVLNKALYGEALPRSPTSYPFKYHF